MYNLTACLNMKISILFKKKCRQRKTRPSLALEHVAAVYLLERVYIWILGDGTEQNLIHFLRRTSFILADRICPTFRCLTRSAVILLAGVPPIQISPQTGEGHASVIYLYRLAVNVTSQHLLVEKVWCCRIGELELKSFIKQEL